jgi:hypothetical protein
MLGTAEVVQDGNFLGLQGMKSLFKLVGGLNFRCEVQLYYHNQLVQYCQYALCYCNSRCCYRPLHDLKWRIHSEKKADNTLAPIAFLQT